ncbi:MAG: hypothetical protein ACLGHP_07710, partial [Vicinamibacteria bacterium]
MSETLLQRWRRLILRAPEAAMPPASTKVVADAPSQPAVVDIDLPSALGEEYAVEYPLARAAAERVLAAVAGIDLSPLARRSPGLAGYDWANYLRCSVARVVRVQRAIATSAAS